MKILVTGAAGYIGSVLTPQLLSLGHQVIALDSFLYGQTSLLDVAANKNLRVLRADARDEQALKQLVPEVDAIIPLACLTGAPLSAWDPIASDSVNLEAIRSIYKAKSKQQLLIYPCTNSGYGIGQEDQFCDETSELKPISLYGKQKVTAETEVLNEGTGVTFRFATLFGASPRMRLDLLVNDFVYRAVNDKTITLFEAHFKRNYLHVRDAVNAFCHTIENYESMRGEAFNVGLSDANLSKSELCEKIQKHVPNFYFNEAKIGEDPDKRNYIVSNEKIENTGFRTQYSLDDGIQELVKTYQIIKRSQFANF